MRLFGACDDAPPDSCSYACVAARLKDEYWSLTHETSDNDSKCGYKGLPIRAGAYNLHIPIFLRFAIGGCEEYNADTVQTMPREPPNPFVNTPGAAFCFSGAAMANHVQAWLGLVGIAVLIGYLIWLRRFIQGRGKRKDETRLTAADYAVMLTGLRRGVQIDEAMEVEGDGGLRGALNKDLEELGFAPGQIDHIAFGCYGRKEIDLLVTLGAMKDNLEVLKKKLAKDPSKRNEEVLAKAEEKRDSVLEKYERELHTPVLSSGQAIVVFKAESDRVEFQKKLKKKHANDWFWSEMKEDLPRSQANGKSLRFASAPEPDAVVWENLELSDARRHVFFVLGIIGVACLLTASVLLMVKLKDLAAHVKAQDESGGLAALTIVSAQKSESTGDQTLLHTLLELFDTFIGVPFDGAVNFCITRMASAGFAASSVKLTISLMCAGQVVIVNQMCAAPDAAPRHPPFLTRACGE